MLTDEKYSIWSAQFSIIARGHACGLAELAVEIGKVPESAGERDFKDALIALDESLAGFADAAAVSEIYEGFSGGLPEKAGERGGGEVGEAGGVAKGEFLVGAAFNVLDDFSQTRAHLEGPLVSVGGLDERFGISLREFMEELGQLQPCFKSVRFGQKHSRRIGHERLDQHENIPSPYRRASWPPHLPAALACGTEIPQASAACKK